MRVCRIITRMNAGGPAQVVRILQGLPVEQVVLAGKVSQGEHELYKPDLYVPWLRRELWPLTDYWAYIYIERFLKLYKPDLVHTHMSKAGLLGRLAAHKLGIPTVHTFHGHVLSGYFGSAKTALIRRIERWLLERSTKLIAICESQKAELIEHLGPEAEAKLVVLPNGVQEPTEELPKHRARKLLGLPQMAFIPLFVGRLVKIKRIERFLDYCEDLRDGAIRSEVLPLVIGDGPDEKLLPRDIVHVPFTKHIMPYYFAADELVTCSDNEGTPTAIIEARFCGRRVVALTTPGGVAEIIEKPIGQLRVDHDPEAFKWRTLKLYKEVLNG